MQSNYSSPHYGNIDGFNEPERSSLSGSGISNGIPTSSSPTPSSYFYDLQMYSNTNIQATNSTTSPGIGHQNMYRSVQEVPYHNATMPSSSNVGTSIQGQRQPTGTIRQVECNGITFIDPFSPSPYNNPSPHHYSPSPVTYNPIMSSNSSTLSTNITKPQYIPEPVSQPLFATFGAESIFVTCPYCHNTDSTDVEQAIGSKALLWACIIPYFGFLLTSKRDTRHRCKNCLNVIGVHYA